jgi:hypothetical protein
MRLFLPKRGLGAWLALFALALQMAVSFGHVHIDGIHGAYPQAKATRFTAHAQPQPAQQPGDDDDYCPICATIYLAANSFVPQPPALPAWFASHAIEHRDHAPTAIIIAARRHPFQSRAPPLA